MEQREANKASIAEQLTQGVVYECGDCMKEVRLRPTDVVVCKYCGYRILYKPRTKRIQQVDAR